MLASVYPLMLFQMTITSQWAHLKISLNATIVKGLNNINIVDALYIGVRLFLSNILHEPNVVIH